MEEQGEIVRGQGASHHGAAPASRRDERHRAQRGQEADQGQRREGRPPSLRRQRLHEQDGHAGDGHYQRRPRGAQIDWTVRAHRGGRT